MINKEKIEKLIAEGRMTIAGMEAVERARNNGSWTILDEVEQLMIPEDLMQAFTLSPAAMQFYDTLSKSLKKVVLQRIAMAKRPETRQKRIIEATQSLALNKKPVV
ncbi:MAG TPA: YdeI/OmpD-associated family protein [Saprospiraceae bacterium]|nr:YdeI/OmpD-associated family protein [Saprospiraceae bacterium]